MTQELAFPELGIFLNLNRVAFAIGPIKVYWYGIIVVTGIALGFFYAYKRREEFDVTADMISDTALYGVIAGIIGARIYYVAFSWDFYKNHPQDIIKIWEGGIAIYGGIIGAVIMILILARHWKINPLNITDCCAAGLILGQAIGRWGYFMNIEAFGGNTTLPWGMTSPVISEYLLSNMEELAQNGIIADPMGMVHPTFLYESIWNLL
ncbi:MAG: prolipoprotein diacylglyceryl transferase, partial [Oscillospiraceae bacterium]